MFQALKRALEAKERAIRTRHLEVWVVIVLCGESHLTFRISTFEPLDGLKEQAAGQAPNDITDSVLALLREEKVALGDAFVWVADE